jgi:hypothetical protein
MKMLISIILTALLVNVGTINAQPGKTNSSTAAPFQGKKRFCSLYRKTIYELSITGSAIKIISLYKEYTSVIKGTIKKGKIYSNDPQEKMFKDYNGKVYLLNKKGDYFRVLNAENGDYDDFTPCK